MKFAKLTSASLQISLAQIASASTEADCAGALVSAAAQMQQAVLAGQSPASFREVLESCQDGAHLGAVMDRAVNFHNLESGGTLGLWLLPVVINADKALPATIALEATGMNALKMSGCLLEQLGLSAAKAAGSRAGWTFVLPTLYSEEQIRNADLGELMLLPHQARDVVRGTRKTVSFTANDGAATCDAGVNLYYLPFVAFAPDGSAPTLPMGSAKTTARMTQWASATLQSLAAESCVVTAGPAPQPFSLALRVGQRLRMDVTLRGLMQRVCVDSGVQANGLAALVAPYATRQTDGTFMVGVTLVSRLTKNVVATLSLPVESQDGQDEVALTIHVLRDLGMDCIQDVPAPIDTTACQHCGEFQFALPSAAVAGNNMAFQAGIVH